MTTLKLPLLYLSKADKLFSWFYFVHFIFTSKGCYIKIKIYHGNYLLFSTFYGRKLVRGLIHYIKQNLIHID